MYQDYEQLARENQTNANIYSQRVDYSKEVKFKPRFNSKSLNLKISSIVGHFKKINAFLVYSKLIFHKTVYNKWSLGKTVHEQIENGLERGFVEPD